ncbi:acetyl-CoA carboxylase biotin carboxylase subunit [Peribacillus frigoritolerans]|jgi:acetyl-CoA carboxylase, biotin carboxylase subunit|uniref:acetyl-CoA carboxylase biotin carboxylase subunit n=1 Tax=Peribacillus TaxID=2675229 RepID=UPI000710C87D|nr:MULTISPECIES: acetyl-CoA carboxylase biotin carboxylase subunit [Peribacillus]KRF49671.1 acetyl-CoA carboxylase biotin carboxylase subunit [Bacillus sp. Soil745]MBT2605172.1 acetyl-CoA carboxylase biotin carboxylase subunit [Bacillus sp. ISL-53]MDP9740175.1 acetyl-CoA carboxylase biotin carboxylase subunit [Bacillus sp. B2I3]PAW30263.1 acetyl-CoA carboxylase biotin carboxylase subunit [Peribacillus simplex]PHD73857.1 acetyl-CoA carboxylase biotin carboxylase subunit [Bacillus sp. AFS043905]
MIKKVLIANRGEIAVRIIRACKELGIETVAVYSEADKEALHVQIADEAYCIGPKLSKDSYLNKTNIISTAKKTGSDAIHPGYGFLAENADFAELCRECNIIFIGPSPEAINKMGTKDVARETMRKAGVPIVPGSKGIIKDTDEGVALANEMGYPVIIKATAGGGGKGIRVARTEEDLIKGINITQQEAATAFGNPGVYIEKFIEDFRHVEIQVMADNHGNAIHLGERDCTVQRRLQKLVEETPSPALDGEIRAEMGQAAVTAALAVNYSGAGTVEFIYDYVNRKYYFMEMNTRIQVEHPVTEMVTGVDLIKEQIKVASGNKLSLSQEDVTYNGWSIECRINAENPEKNFMPSAGKIQMYLPPGGYGVRVDSAAYPGYSIPPYYDSMIAKLIVHAPTREEAIEKMKRALGEFVIEGISTTIPFHIKLLQHEQFVSGEFNTKFLEIYDVMNS